MTDFITLGIGPGGDVPTFILVGLSVPVTDHRLCITASDAGVLTMTVSDGLALTITVSDAGACSTT